MHTPTKQQRTLADLVESLAHEVGLQEFSDWSFDQRWIYGKVQHAVEVCRADSVWIESFRFSPHSIYPFFAENRGVFEAIFRFADKPQILNVRFSYSSVVLSARFSIFTIGMLRTKSKLSIQTEFAL